MIKNNSISITIFIKRISSKYSRIAQCRAVETHGGGNSAALCIYSNHDLGKNNIQSY